MPTASDTSVAHPLYAAVDLLAARHHITPHDAQRRLEDVAENLGISCIELAELMLIKEAVTDGR